MRQAHEEAGEFANHARPRCADEHDAITAGLVLRHGGSEEVPHDPDLAREFAGFDSDALAIRLALMFRTWPVLNSIRGVPPSTLTLQTRPRFRIAAGE